MKVAFAVFDRNEDGKISKEELAEVLKETEVVFTEDQLNDFMERVDKDGKCIVNLNFLYFYTKHILSILFETKFPRHPRHSHTLNSSYFNTYLCLFKIFTARAGR